MYSFLNTDNSSGETVNQLFPGQKVVANLEKGRGDNLSIGIIGAGNFAAFAANVFITISGIKIIAVADVNEMACNKLADELKAKYHLDYMDLLADNSINLVYIATPPHLHFEMSKNALLAGKHVICEKPAALKTVDVITLQALAKEFQLLYVVNLMQRYNPLYKTVQEIIQQKMMGNFLHGFFTVVLLVPLLLLMGYGLIRLYKHLDKSNKERMQNYSRSWICLKCGTGFIPHR